VNDIELSEIKSPSLKNVSEYASAIKESAEFIGLVKPTPENAELCAKEVAKFNKQKKDAKAVLDSIRKKWDEPLDDALKPVTEALAGYSSKSSDYADSVLSAKKEAYKKSAYDSFLKYASVASKDGSIPDWESFYEPSWYGRPKEDLDSLVSSKLRIQLTKDDEETACFQVKGTKAEIQSVRDFMVSNRITFGE
jgi:hypothetical protein